MSEKSMKDDKSGLSSASLDAKQSLERSFTYSDHTLSITVSTLLGVGQLLIWNMLIESSVGLNDVTWPKKDFLSLVGGAEHAAALFVCVLMIKWFDGLSILWCQIVTLINCLLFLMLPLVSTFFPGNENYNTALILLMMLGVALGACSGALHSYGYAFASVLPHSYVAWVSTGNGIVGVYSFAVYLLLSLLFPSNTQATVNTIMWIFFTSGAVICFFQFLLFTKLSRKQWFRDCVHIAQYHKQHNLNLIEKEWGPKRAVIPIIKDCFSQAWNVGFVLFVTLLIFPACGPLKWPLTPLLRTIAIGSFQITDLLLRMLPIYGSWTMIPKKYLWILVNLRAVIFIPLFIIPWKKQDIAVLASTPWLLLIMILLTVSNGWMVTVGSIHCTESIQHPEEKEIASEFLVIMILIGVTAGIYASKLLLTI